MIKAFILLILVVFTGIFILTQIIVPLFTPSLKLFWLFREKAKEQPRGILSELEQKVDTTMEQYRTVTKEVDEVATEIDNIKAKTRK